MQSLTVDNIGDAKIESRARELFDSSRDALVRSTDRMFAILMLIQWVAGVAAALIISPRTWAGAIPQVHVHVWTAVLCGGALSSLPIYLGLCHPGERATRYVIAVAQMMWSALLIHLTGGRIETHFHVFGSLAFLAFYRDWRVLVPATIVVVLDHAIRGIVWPQSVYGVLTAAPWRSMEHAAWVVFEDIFLIHACRRSRQNMKDMSLQRALLLHHNESMTIEVEKKTAELRSSLESEAAIFDNAADGIMTINQDGIVLRYNAAAKRIFGYTSEEVVGQNIKMLMRSPTREQHDGYLTALFDSDLSHVIGRNSEAVGQHKNGKSVALELNIAHVKTDAKGFFVGIVRDIEDRKTHEQSLAERTRLAEVAAEVNQCLTRSVGLRSMLQQCAELMQPKLDAAFFRIWTLNESENILNLQASAGMYTHIDGDHAQVPVGKFKIGLIAEEAKPHLTNDVLNDPRVGDQGWAHRERMVAFAGYPLMVGGKVIGVMAMFSRNTLSRQTLDVMASIADSVAVGIERKRAEAELVQVNQALVDASRQAGMAEMATGVLHNIGNAITGVNTSTHCLTERVKCSKVSRLVQAAEMIKDHHHDLAEFITSNERGKHLPAFLCKVAGHLTSEQDAILKELKSLSAGVEHINNIVATQQSYAKTSNISEEIDCAALLDQVVQLQVGALERRGIEVIREFTGHPLINADKHKMLQILLNLVRNASHAMLASDKKDRRLTLRLRSKDENAYIEVADNGIGIESENLTKVFSHGFTTKKDGHGFGLHSAALAAQDMGGSLNVHSDGPGLGATFILQIPIQDPNSPPIEKANGRSAETTRQPHHARNHKE